MHGPTPCKLSGVYLNEYSFPLLRGIKEKKDKKIN